MGHDAKLGFVLNAADTWVLHFGRLAVAQRCRDGMRRSEMFDVIGFTLDRIRHNVYRIELDGTSYRDRNVSPGA